MKRLFPLATALIALPASAEDVPVTPASIVNAAPQEDWVVIDPADMLVMELAPDVEGHPRRVVIQLMPPPFSQGWVGNIRKLAKAHWWDGTSVYRVQDNYVTQWGDVTEKKPLPEGLEAVPESAFTEPLSDSVEMALDVELEDGSNSLDDPPPSNCIWDTGNAGYDCFPVIEDEFGAGKPYASYESFKGGFPFASDYQRMWPIHCYGMVGVARDLETTGTGSDLYVVIGQAPRQLDRNIALVGRVIDGMENLSALPRGHGELGFYGEDEADKRVPILSVRLGSELPEGDPASSSEAVGQTKSLQFEYLSTESDSFTRYLNARANRRDDFYKVPAGGVDICNAPVPVRAFEYND